MNFSGALSPVLAQASYLFPNTPMTVEQLFHLHSDSTAHPFDISFSPDPTVCHYCPYTTIGADVNITGPPPTPKKYQPEDILNTITANADNNLQRHEHGKLLGRTHKSSTPTTSFIHGDDIIGELYQKNMVLIYFTIDPWAWFSPMLQAFLTTTHHPPQKTWHTTHTNNKYHQLNANLMYKYECASQSPCPLGILTSANLQWKQAALSTWLPEVLWQLLHCTHTKSAYSSTPRTQYF